MPGFQSFRKYEVPLVVGRACALKGLAARGMEMLLFESKVLSVINTSTVLHIVKVPSVLRTASITIRTFNVLHILSEVSLAMT